MTTKLLFVLTLCGFATCAGAPQLSPERAEAALQAAMNKETVEGDLKGAIEQYQAVVQSGNRPAAGKALLRIGICQEKLGAQEARQTYERIIREFADQSEQVAAAKMRLNGGGNGVLDTKVTYSTAKKSVQYVVIDLARLGGLGYNWDKSFSQTDPDCRRWVTDVNIKNKPLREAIDSILKPVGLRFEVENKAVVLYRAVGNQGRRPETVPGRPEYTGKLKHTLLPGTAIGWYNGDWQTGIPGLESWYVSEDAFARVHDDFVVPKGGWTVAGVFAYVGMKDHPGATKASWEIRSGASAGHGGKLVASGVSPATQTLDRSIVNADGKLYRIQVDGLQVRLKPGRYWLSVSPVGKGSGKWYAETTIGANAIGEPSGNNARAFFSWTTQDTRFQPTETLGRAGKDFSQGVLIVSGGSGTVK